jgi:hypothetical protein
MSRQANSDYFIERQPTQYENDFVERHYADATKTRPSYHSTQPIQYSTWNSSVEHPKPHGKEN